MAQYWLVKTEADVYSIDDFRRDRKTMWDGVRNYQARNYLRAMKRGDLVFVYHSNSEPTGIVGIATVSREAVPDALQFDRKSDYFDPKASKLEPRWYSPELKLSQAFKRCLPITELRKVSALSEMVLFQRGSRLSVQPVTAAQYAAIVAETHGGS